MSLRARIAVLSFAGVVLAAPAPALGAAGTGGTAVPDGGAIPSATAGGVSPDRPAYHAGPGTPTRRPTLAPPGSGVRDVPASYLRLYRAAATREGVDWRILAAIGKVESDHGRSAARGVRSGLNSARCCAGPLQLCTVRSCGRVWQHYAVDADADGTASVYDPPDAIAAAAALVADLRHTVGARADFLFAAYNAGPQAVLRHHRVPHIAETQAYVRNGLRYMASLTRR
jgi:hypothetical protein